MEVEIFVLVLIEKNRCTCRGFEMSNKPGFLIGFDISLEYFQPYLTWAID